MCGHFLINCVLYDLETFIELGETFGLEGAELLAIVKEQQEREEKCRREEDENEERLRIAEKEKVERRRRQD